MLPANCSSFYPKHDSPHLEMSKARFLPEISKIVSNFYQNFLKEVSIIMNRKTNRLYRFNEFQLEVNERLLKRGQNVVSITPKAFDILVLLLENKGKIVEKEMLLNSVWADTYIGEATLAQNILTLRKILGKQPDGKNIIETVPRFGYRFIGEVSEFIGNEEILSIERHIKTEITTEHQALSEDEAVTIRKTDAQKRSLFYLLKQNKVYAIVAGLCLVTIFASIAFSLRYLLSGESYSESKFNQIDVTKLTAEGNVSRAALSPDGKYLAYSTAHSNGEWSISVKQIENSAMVQILSPQKYPVTGLSFSPDGNQVYYILYERDTATNQLYGHLFSVPMLGGIPKALLIDIDGPLAVSPDGKQIAFLRFSPGDKKVYLMIAGNDGKNEKIITSRNYIDSFSPGGLVWSPDSQTIACPAFIYGEIGKQMEVILVDVKTGEQKSLDKENWLWIGQPDWLKDGSGIVFPAWNSRSGNATDEIWLVSTKGVVKQISGGINGVVSLNMTADSNALMAIKSERITDLWTASAPDLKQTNTKILQNRSDFIRSFPGLGWLSDKQVVFGSSFNGNLDVWMMNADGSQRRQITTDKSADFFPTISGDRKTIVFISNRLGRENLWRMDADGNKQEQLTDEINVSTPTFAPDNRSVYYLSLDEKINKYLLRKIDLETKQSTQITSYSTAYPRISPDGKFIACYYADISNSNINETNLKLTIFSTENYQVVRQFDAPFNQDRRALIDWKGNESLTYFISESGNTKLWEQPINGEKAKVLLDLPVNSVFRFAWSADGKKLVYESGIQVNDAILIRNKEGK